jgi:hypothetical protein
MIVDECTMDAARYGRCVFRNQFRMSRVRRVVKGNSVLPIRGAFT